MKILVDPVMVEPRSCDECPMNYPPCDEWGCDIYCPGFIDCDFYLS